MCKAFAFRLSPEATSDENLMETADSLFDMGDGVADFGWTGSRTTSGLTDYEVVPSGTRTGISVKWNGNEQ